ncbi:MULTISPECIES: hypothetical protein [unclassified Mesorhizobium]|uniref:hypothetical protein n=1 Tax=unclassified Mesorhizobium TaxID=325217 RepID=UPI00112C19E2|nr:MULTISPECIES: hypothetical protein [unclassified Mesorhizobium]TPK42652.1 hypothetical protein FJ550_29800 [Mesorhizobium sp. B2-5-2]TPL26772.1 hypothetical protein FJ946_13120 [Mesorhizobium sp. B2-4-7]TPL40550.1 hypothetical protein FJ961_17420 [Mesorhizobium sp. B2-4-5]TPM76824.1 hypothetical protein FJ968_03650 [Mesorhizobium sp. B2-1-6]TPN72487.1 hypothetical protein FJ985_29305 [Mesorhizobium sp. B1-1-2]
MSAMARSESFNAVSNMEKPLSVARDLAAALAMVAETMSSDEGSVVQRLAWLAEENIAAAEALRCDLFRLTHPSREHFEKAGWPGDAPRKGRS